MAITNVNELRDFLSKDLERTSRGEITPATANATANLAGKIISTIKMELDYNRMAGLQPNIGFINATDNKIKKLDKKEH